MVVEDSTLITNAIKLILEKEGITVFSTKNGAEVVDIVKKENIDLVMLDLMMPEVSGDEVFKMLKADTDTKEIKILILTARADALKWNIKLQGCDKFMSKPFDNDALKEEVVRLLTK